MPTMQTEGQTNPANHRTNRLPEMAWNEIERPGSYLIVGTGDLVRIPPEALAAGHSPLISLTSYEEKRLAKLTDSPATPISKLRTIAADNDFFVNF